MTPPPMVADHQVTEDTPVDLFEGSMDLLVVLPNDKCLPMSFERRLPLMDLLIHIANTHKFSPGGHVLEVIDSQGSTLSCKPSTRLGTLNAHTVYVVAKNKINERLKSTLSAKSVRATPAAAGSAQQQPFENTFRVQIRLPRNQLYVIRATWRTSLSEILQRVCADKGLDAHKYELRHPVHSDERLELSRTLADYQLQELSVVPQGQNITSAVSLNDVAAMRKATASRAKSPAASEAGTNGNAAEKKRRGLFGFVFGKKTRSGVGESISNSSNSAADRSLSPPRSEEPEPPAVPTPEPVAVSPSPPSPVLVSKRLAEEAVAKRNSRLMMLATVSNESLSPVQDKPSQQPAPQPKPPARQKKKAAPPPPPQPAEPSSNGTPKRPASIISSSSTSSESTAVSSPPSVIIRSAAASDISSDISSRPSSRRSIEPPLPTKGPVGMKDSPARPSSTTPKKAAPMTRTSMTNLNQVSSTSELSLVSSAKKRKAPPPPPAPAAQPEKPKTPTVQKTSPPAPVAPPVGGLDSDRSSTCSSSSSYKKQDSESDPSYATVSFSSSRNTKAKAALVVPSAEPVYAMVVKKNKTASADTNEVEADDKSKKLSPSVDAENKSTSSSEDDSEPSKNLPLQSPPVVQPKPLPRTRTVSTSSSSSESNTEVAAEDQDSPVVWNDEVPAPPPPMFQDDLESKDKEVEDSHSDSDSEAETQTPVVEDSPGVTESSEAKLTLSLGTELEQETATDDLDGYQATALVLSQDSQHFGEESTTDDVVVCPPPAFGASEQESSSSNSESEPEFLEKDSLNEDSDSSHGVADEVKNPASSLVAETTNPAPQSATPSVLALLSQAQNLLNSTADPNARALQEEFVRLQQQLFVWQQSQQQQPVEQPKKKAALSSSEESEGSSESRKKTRRARRKPRATAEDSSDEEEKMAEQRRLTLEEFKRKRREEKEKLDKLKEEEEERKRKESEELRRNEEEERKSKLREEEERKRREEIERAEEERQRREQEEERRRREREEEERKRVEEERLRKEHEEEERKKKREEEERQRIEEERLRKEKEEERLRKEREEEERRKKKEEEERQRIEEERLRKEEEIEKLRKQREEEEKEKEEEEKREKESEEREKQKKREEAEDRMRQLLDHEELVLAERERDLLEQKRRVQINASKRDSSSSSSSSDSSDTEATKQANVKPAPVYRYRGPPQVTLEPWKPGRPKSEVIDLSSELTFDIPEPLLPQHKDSNKMETTQSSRDSPDSGIEGYDSLPAMPVTPPHKPEPPAKTFSLSRAPMVDTPRPFKPTAQQLFKRSTFVPVVNPVPFVQRKINKAPEVRGFSSLPTTETTESSSLTTVVTSAETKPRLLTIIQQEVNRHQIAQDDKLQSLRKIEIRQKAGVFERPQLRPVSMPVPPSGSSQLASIETPTGAKVTETKRRISPAKFARVSDPRDDLLKSIRDFSSGTGLRKTGVTLQ